VSFSRRNKDNSGTYILGGIGVLILTFFIISITGGCGRGYSEGSRSGQVTKFSNKGLMFKSWEGEMNLGGMKSNGDGNLVPNVWLFSVTDESLIDEIKSAQENGERLTVHYEEYLISPVDQDSGYTAVKVEVKK